MSYGNPVNRVTRSTRHLWTRTKTLLRNIRVLPPIALGRRFKLTSHWQSSPLPPSPADSFPTQCPIVFEKPPRPPVDPAHNASRPINRLPPELLAQIFLLHSEECPSNDISRVSCSHVCSSWRQIAIETPTLWSRVIFTSQSWMERCLERTKSSPLRVEAELLSERSGAEFVLSRVAAVLAMAERITKIDLAFYWMRTPPTEILLHLLVGPFPVLNSLSIRDCDNPWLADWAVLNGGFVFPCGIQVEVYPQLRELSIGRYSRFFKSANLPEFSNLVSLRVDEISVWSNTWNSVANALDPMVALQELSIGHLAPYDSTQHPQNVCLPSLYRLSVGTGEPANATKLLHALKIPQIREVDIKLDTVPDTKMLLLAIFKLVGQPRAMRIEHINGIDPNVRGALPAHSPIPGHFQHAMLSLSSSDLEGAWASPEYPYDVCLSWEESSLSESDMCSIVTAVLDTDTAINNIQWLVLVNWGLSPEHFWCRFASHIPHLKRLAIMALPPAGLLWALLHDMQADCTLLSALHTIRLDDVNLGAGGWLASPGGPAGTISYFERDNARFIEVLLCYVGTRRRQQRTQRHQLPPEERSGLPRLRLEVINCTGFTVPEVKLLRMLSERTFWDGNGAIRGRYGMHWDEEGGATIYHDLLSGEHEYAGIAD
ncbi:F-box domain-containing protein [Mycena indigotica]|uniref:F-box domain-containing protein n=1 Tax=Mycena indigotica TaxID=2126181 RepID=A0A8H6T4H7_9AGAR|nr:F-box domain-containing protein [Mycena indigotica]KAF7310091.1 F-box domain-containing protein [Mycena indigotica]